MRRIIIYNAALLLSMQRRLYINLPTLQIHTM